MAELAVNADHALDLRPYFLSGEHEIVLAVLNLASAFYKWNKIEMRVDTYCLGVFLFGSR